MARRRPSIATALKESLPQDSGILVALSGGKDSSVMLHAALGVARLRNLRVEACHVDHGFRANSAEDAGFVAGMCKGLSVECHVVRLGAKPPQANLEAWGREHRYRVLREVREERKLDWIATAHTANDVAETLLIRLLANKELGSIERRDESRRVLRPLLDISREQIDEYATQHSVAFQEDPTNADTTLVRNRVRHTLIPQLERDFDPSMVWILSERAQALAADSEALKLVAENVARELGGVQEGEPAWLERCAATLAAQPEALRWRVAEALARPLVGFSLGENRSKSLVGFLTGRCSALQLTAEITLEQDRFGIRVKTEKLKVVRTLGLG